MNADAKCRGCAGHGLDITLTPRQMQLVLNVRFELHDPEQPTRHRYATVSAAEDRGRGYYKGPLAHAMAYLDNLMAQGWEESQPIPFSKGWACDWCHGTGQPELSEHTLETELLGTKGEAHERA